jgi:hypothetical protein
VLTDLVLAGNPKASEAEKDMGARGRATAPSAAHLSAAVGLLRLTVDKRKPVSALMCGALPGARCRFGKCAVPLRRELAKSSLGDEWHAGLATLQLIDVRVRTCTRPALTPQLRAVLRAGSADQPAASTGAGRGACSATSARRPRHLIALAQRLMDCQVNDGACILLWNGSTVNGTPYVVRAAVGK